MDSLAQLALRFPEVPLVLAHAAIADQGMFASRLAEHPAVVYDTSCFAALDVVELFARVPAERIVFASDIPYGRPVPALHLALRVAAYAGLDEQERALVAGGTMTALVERRPLVPTSAPRVRQERAVSGRLLRVSGYIATAFGAIVGAGPPRELTRGLPHLQLARAACRDPEPGAAGPALERIDTLLAAAQELIGDGTGEEMNAYALIIAAGAIAATEPVA
jgi:Amidohydrolase